MMKAGCENQHQPTATSNKLQSMQSIKHNNVVQVTCLVAIMCLAVTGVSSAESTPPDPGLKAFEGKSLDALTNKLKAYRHRIRIRLPRNYLGHAAQFMFLAQIFKLYKG